MPDLSSVPNHSPNSDITSANSLFARAPKLHTAEQQVLWNVCLY